MQDLHNDLMKESGETHPELKDMFTDLLNTSIKWAEYCLRNNSGKALEHGLNISKELANYQAEIDNPC